MNTFSITRSRQLALACNAIATVVKTSSSKRVSILMAVRKLTGLIIALLFDFSPAVRASTISDAKHPGKDLIERMQPNGGYAISVIVLLTGILFFSGLSQAYATGADPRVPIVDGDIYSLATKDSTLYIGGDFRAIGPYTGRGAVFNSAGEFVSDWPIVNNNIETVIPDGAGGWYIGGRFTQVGGLPRTGLAHILPDKSVDPDFVFNVIGASPPVYVLHLVGNTLYVGGNFTVIGGEPRNNLAAINLQDNIITDWDPDVNSLVFAITNLNNTIYVGGVFRGIDGQGRDRIAAINSTANIAGNYLTGWNPGANSEVWDLEIYDSDSLLAGGEFSVIDNTTAYKLARLRLDTVTPGEYMITNYNITGGSSVRDIEESGDIVYACGDITYINGTTRRYSLAAFPIGGGLYPWNPVVIGGDVTDMEIVGTTLYVAGSFDAIDGKIQNNLAAIDLTASTAGEYLFDWQPVIGGNRISGLARWGTSFFAGGDQLTAGGVQRSNLAAIDLQSWQVTNWNPGVLGGWGVYSILVDGDTLYAGGVFNEIDGVSRTNIAAIDITATQTGQYLRSWDPTISRASSPRVTSLALGGTTLYAGGWFDQADGIAVENIVALDTTATVPGNYVDTNWLPLFNGGLDSLMLQGNTLYVGGWFSMVNGQSANNLVTLDTTASGSGFLMDWQPAIDGQVYDMLLQGSMLYIGGEFSIVDGEPRVGLAALDTTASSAGNYVLPWNPAPDNSEIPSLALHGDTLFFSGDILMVDGVGRDSIAAVHTRASQSGDYLTAWDPDGRPYSYDMLFWGDTLIIGGYTIGEIDGVIMGGLAAYSFQPPTTTVDVPAGTYDSSQMLVLSCNDHSGTGCAGTWYSTDGSEPATAYAAPIIIESDTTLRYYSKDNEGIAAPVQSDDYNIVPPTSDGGGGGGGGGCTLSNNRPFDPLLPVMLGLALIYLARSHGKRSVQNSHAWSATSCVEGEYK